ncbi:GntR family transcriptional regulator [Paenibacillus sp. KACC 21273]|uniref:GntR family transcriptional regulator n=1 Tax=Paenibacillus sp. KACC 21273 TaxID=3025665 RepID=UPI002365B122|nr:GntR family transcriptional regulator [Paenibacillus sp. KACC 21273]WDF50116.1 GntR family transcriptional regulator [Paenibacillus sp. KACC 21273]
MFELDVRSRKPIYEQLMDKIKEMIMYGILKPEEQLPSVRSLSTQLTVNPNTIQKAYRELEREGYIYSQPGKGSFVSPQQQQPTQEQQEDMRERLLKLFAEAIYLGFTREDLIKLYKQAMQEHERGHHHD